MSESLMGVVSDSFNEMFQQHFLRLQQKEHDRPTTAPVAHDGMAREQNPRKRGKHTSRASTMHAHNTSRSTSGKKSASSSRRREDAIPRALAQSGDAKLGVPNAPLHSHPQLAADVEEDETWDQLQETVKVPFEAAPTSRQAHQPTSSAVASIDKNTHASKRRSIHARAALSNKQAARNRSRANQASDQSTQLSAELNRPARRRRAEAEQTAEADILLGDSDDDDDDDHHFIQRKLRDSNRSERTREEGLALKSGKRDGHEQHSGHAKASSRSKPPATTLSEQLIMPQVYIPMTWTLISLRKSVYSREDVNALHPAKKQLNTDQFLLDLWKRSTRAQFTRGPQEQSRAAPVLLRRGIACWKRAGGSHQRRSMPESDYGVAKFSRLAAEARSHVAKYPEFCSFLSSAARNGAEVRKVLRKSASKGVSKQRQDRRAKPQRNSKQAVTGGGRKSSIGGGKEKKKA